MTARDTTFAQDHIVREFRNAVQSYRDMHGVGDAKRPLHGNAGAQDGTVPCASHASGVEVRRDGEAPQVSQACRPDGANSSGSAVAGPYNAVSGLMEQPSEASKPRYYKHHAMSGGRAKKARDTREVSHVGAKRPHEPTQDPHLRHPAHPGPAQASPGVPGGGGGTGPPGAGLLDAQAAAAAGLSSMYGGATGYPMYPLLPGAMPPGTLAVPSNAWPSSMRPAAYNDPKFWQAVQGGLLPPPPVPPMLMGFNTNPGLAAWQMQLANAIAGQQMLQQAAMASAVRQQAYPTNPTHLTQTQFPAPHNPIRHDPPPEASTAVPHWGMPLHTPHAPTAHAPAPSTQSLAPGHTTFTKYAPGQPPGQTGPLQHPHALADAMLHHGPTGNGGSGSPANPQPGLQETARPPPGPARAPSPIVEPLPVVSAPTPVVELPPVIAPAPSAVAPPLSLAESCKVQIAHMAHAGLPSEEQIEAAAKGKALEMGDPSIAQLLMAWYYAGYFTGKALGTTAGSGGGHTGPSGAPAATGAAAAALDGKT